MSCNFAYLLFFFICLDTPNDATDVSTNESNANDMPANESEDNDTIRATKERAHVQLDKSNNDVASTNHSGEFIEKSVDNDDALTCSFDSASLNLNNELDSITEFAAATFDRNEHNTHYLRSVSNNDGLGVMSRLPYHGSTTSLDLLQHRPHYGDSPPTGRLLNEGEDSQYYNSNMQNSVFTSGSLCSHSLSIS